MIQFCIRAVPAAHCSLAEGRFAHAWKPASRLARAGAKWGCVRRLGHVEHFNRATRQRVEPDLPGGGVHGDAFGARAAGELAIQPRRQDLLDARILPQLAAQQSDLVLAAAPFAARVHLQHAHASRPRYAGTFTTPASTRLSSSSLKGF